MPVDQDFANDPDAFLRSHIVIQACPNVPLNFASGDRVRVTVQQTDSIVHHEPYMLVCFMRVAHGTDAYPVDVYWCPYVQNDIKTTTLGNLALYMFTPTM